MIADVHGHGIGVIKRSSVLIVLALSAGAVSSEAIHNRVSHGETNTTNVYTHRIRKKMAAAGQTPPFVNSRGEGFLWQVEA